MRSETHRQLLIKLKRPAVIVLYLIVCRVPVTAKQISVDLEIDYETCRTYLNELRSLGLISRLSTGKFILSTAGEQLPLFGIPVQLQNAEIPRFDPIIINNLNKKEEPIIVINSDETRINRVLELFAEHGILHNAKTSALVANEYITVEYVKSKILELKLKGKSLPTWNGLLIQILSQPPTHPANCQCDHCDYNYRHQFSKWDSD